MSNPRKYVYFNEQAREDLQYVFERMKVFGLIPSAAEDIGQHRAQVIAYALRHWVEMEQQRLKDIEDLERNESALESALANATAWRGEEAQAEDAEYLEALQTELNETRRELGKL